MASGTKFVQFTALVLACTTFLIVTGQQVTVAEVEVATRRLRTEMRGNSTLGPGAMRLAFHSCIGDKCDGCVNMAQEDNAGLDGYIEKLEDIYVNLTQSSLVTMSRADFWILASIVAYEVTSRSEGEVVFRYGRTDCGIGPTVDDVHTFPSALHGNEQVVDFFKTAFNFSPRETAAIMGAHTLGRGHPQPQGSGFDLPWVGAERRFDNQYYINLIDRRWTQVEVTPGFYWLNNGGNQMMLNSDVALIKDQAIDDPTTGRASCTFRQCADLVPDPTNPEAPQNTQNWAVLYKDDNALFLNDFKDAFQKMIEWGYDNLNDL